MTETNFEKVGEFMRRLGLPTTEGDPPALPEPALGMFRIELILEETTELVRAYRKGDLEEVADALADLVYVTLGLAHHCGIPFDEVFDEVHRANMQKRRSDGSDTKRGFSTDAAKPEGWTPPDVAGAMVRGLRRVRLQATRKWDYRFMRLAEGVSAWSKDPNTRVGAVLVGRNPRDISLGYNGFPPGIQDDDRLQDRYVKRVLMQHAERNALDNARFDTGGSTLYTTFAPCIECTKSAITLGVSRIVYRDAPTEPPWTDSFRNSEHICNEAGVKLEQLGAQDEPA